MKRKEEKNTKSPSAHSEWSVSIKGSGIRNTLIITVREIAPEQRWILHGRLTDDSAAEVLSNWYSSKEQESVGPRVIDLDGVSVIDRSGERVLALLIQDGARIGGIYARHLLVALQESTESKTQLN
jgi:anti-anti-sigma regulatory factor